MSIQRKYPVRSGWGLAYLLAGYLFVTMANAQLGDTSSLPVNGWLLPATVQALEQQMRDAYQTRKSCKPEPPIEVRLDLSHAPSLGQPVQVVFSVLPFEYLHNAEISWDVSEGITLLTRPQPLQNLQIDTKGVSQYRLVVQFNRPGRYEIAASVVERGNGFTMGRRVHLYFDVRPDGTIEVSRLPFYEPRKEPPQAQEVSPSEQITQPAPDSIAQFGTPPPPQFQPVNDDQTVSPQGPTGTARVRGYFRYRHRDGTLHGAYGALVQIWDRDNWSGDDLLAEAICGSDGFFETPDFDNGNDGDPFDDASQEPYVRWFARNGRVNVTHYTDGHNFQVNGPSRTDLPDGVWDIGSWFIDTDGPGSYPDDGVEAAYEICDALSRAWASYNYGLGYDLALVNCRWREGGSDGPIYEGGPRRITLRDGDQQDDSVIFHEYGHHVMQMVKGGFPPGSGGAHAWFGCYNGGLAWSEGWATYSGQSSLGNTTYCDTPGVGDSANFCVNVETTTGNCLDGTAGTTGEASVASALWDVYDNLGGDPHTRDRLALGRNEIWDTFANGGTINHMMDFINAWFARGHDFDSAFRDIMRDHRILPEISNFVTVEIDHTYRGDLVVDVGVGNPDAPLYSKRIWNRAGGSADNLYIQESVADAPSFYLNNPSENVVWFCKVYDGAGADQGTLRRFSLTTNTTYVSGNVPQPVTDFNSTFAFYPTRTARHALIGLDHTYRGDLVVTIGAGDPSSPLWSRVVANRTGGSLDHMWCQVDLSSATAYLPPNPSTCNMRGWWVKVEDRAGGAQGTLHTFRINNNGTVTTTNDPSQSIVDFGTAYLRQWGDSVHTAIVLTSGAYGQTVPLQVRMNAVNLGSWICNRVINFSVDGNPVGSDDTDTNGWAVVNYTIPESLSVGTHNVTFAFAGDFFFNARSATVAALTVQKANTSLTVPNRSGFIGQTVQLQATLRRTTDNATLSGKTVQFRVDGNLVGSANTNASGVATLNYTIPNISCGNHTLQASFASDSWYNASTGNGTLQVRLQGDVDGNRVVDDADLLRVLFAFGQTGSRPEDVNGDGVVDDADLLTVLFNFGRSC